MGVNAIGGIFFKKFTINSPYLSQYGYIIHSFCTRFKKVSKQQQKNLPIKLSPNLSRMVKVAWYF